MPQSDQHYDDCGNQPPSRDVLTADVYANVLGEVGLQLRRGNETRFADMKCGAVLGMGLDLYALSGTVYGPIGRPLRRDLREHQRRRVSSLMLASSRVF